jgi:autotransporter-associated beta strand protein
MCSRCKSLSLALGAAVFVVAVLDSAASTWTNLAAGNGSGVWGGAANWSGGVPNGTDAIADFSTLNLAADSTVTNDVPRSIGTLLFADTTAGNNWSLTGSALTLAVSSGTPLIDVSNQTATISAVLGGSQGFTKSGAGTLALNNTNNYTGATIISGGMLQLPASPPIPSGTVGYWQFNNSANLGADTGGQGNTLKTASGTPAYSGAGKFGGALYLDGSSTMNTLSGTFPSGVPTSSAAYTIAVWERIDTGCSGTGGFIGWGANSTSQANNLRLNSANGIDNYWFSNDFVVNGLAANPMDGNWHSIVVTWDGTTQTFYVDGAPVGSRNPTPPNVQGSGFIVGKTTADANFKGWLDNLMVVNRALTTAEIASYQAGFNSLNSLPPTTSVQMSGGGALNLNGTSQTVGSLTGDASASVLLGSSVLTVSNSANATFGGRISGASSLIKSGTGTLTLSGTNTYTGSTTITAGTLALNVPGGASSIVSNSAGIGVANGATFDISGVSGGFRLATGQTLSGAGAVKGTLAVDPGATLQPGSGASGTVTLTFSNALNLAGNTVLNINRASAQKADLVVTPSLVLGGTVTVQNSGATPLLGDTFQLFDVSGAISNAGVFPVLPVLGAGVHWDYSQLVTNGTVTVAGGASTIFNVKSYGAKGDGVANDWSAFNTAIQAAIAAGPGSVVSVPGATYYLSSGTLTVNNANGITIQGDPNALLINGSTSDLFRIQNSSNVTVQVIKIDTQPLRFTQGTVNTLAANRLSMTVTLDSGFKPFSDPMFTNLPSQQLIFWTDPNCLAFDRNNGGNMFAGATLISGNQWTVTLTGTLPTTVVGKKFAMWHDYGGWAMNLSDNTGPVNVTDFTYYGGGAGACIGMYRNLAPVTLTRVTVGPPPGSGRMISASGTFDSQGNRAALTLDGCDVSLTQEDTLDIGTDLGHILSTNSSTQIVVENTEKYVVGDTVQIWDWTYQNQHVRDTATVTGASLNGGNWTLTLNHPVQIINTGAGPGNANWSAQEADGIDRCVSLQNAAPGTVIKNSRFQTSGRTFNMKAANCTITNNLFYQTPWNIFCAAETFWHGGPAPRNLTIVNNTFSDIDVAPIEVEVRASSALGACTNILISGNYFTNCGAHSPYADGVYGPRTDIRGAGVCLRNVVGAVVTNNYFDGIWGPPVVIQMSSNVQVLNNTMANTHQHYWNNWGNYGADMGAEISIASSSQSIVISGNLVSNMGIYGAALVSPGGAQSVSGTANGIFQTDQPFNFVNDLSSLPLDGAGAAGVSPTQRNRNGGDGQRWMSRLVGNGHFTLTCRTNNLNLGVGNSTASGTPLLLETPSGADDQLWTFAPFGNTNVLLVNKYSGLAAAVTTSGSGEIVAQQTPGSGLGQQWFLQGAPLQVTATAGYNQVLLSWRAFTGATGYNVKRSLTSGGPYTTIAALGAVTSLTDSGLLNGTAYYYVISAITTLGEGPNSLEVTATPSILGARRVWFKADAITGLASGTAVSTWSDASGNGYNAGASSSAPTYITGALNGLPVVRFSKASSTYMTFTRPVQDDFTIILFYQSSQSDQGTSTDFYGGAGLVNGEQGGPVNDFGTSLNANGQVIGGTGNPDTSIASGTGFNNGQPHVVTFKRTRSTGAIVLYVDGTQVGTKTGGTQSLTSPAQLIMGGVTTGGGYLSGDIVEVQIFNAPLPDSDRIAEENALKCKYGLGGGAAPGTPTGLKATAGNRQISLAWVPTAGATSYNLYRSGDGINYLLLTNLVASSVVDILAVSGQTNYYTVAAMDGCGSSATSAAVGVFLALPQLKMSLDAGLLTISWPDWASDWVLYGTTNLVPPVVWTGVTNAVTDSNGQFNVAVPIAPGNQFFRLSSL